MESLKHPIGMIKTRLKYWYQDSYYKNLLTEIANESHQKNWDNVIKIYNDSGLHLLHFDICDYLANKEYFEKNPNLITGLLYYDNVTPTINKIHFFVSLAVREKLNLEIKELMRHSTL